MFVHSAGLTCFHWFAVQHFNEITQCVVIQIQLSQIKTSQTKVIFHQPDFHPLYHSSKYTFWSFVQKIWISYPTRPARLLQIQSLVRATVTVAVKRTVERWRNHSGTKHARWQKQATATPSKAPARTWDGVWPRSSLSFLLLMGCPWNRSSTITFRTCHRITQIYWIIGMYPLYYKGIIFSGIVSQHTNKGGFYDLVTKLFSNLLDHNQMLRLQERIQQIIIISLTDHSETPTMSEQNHNILRQPDTQNNHKQGYVGCAA